jgi:hypothetical protein
MEKIVEILLKKEKIILDGTDDLIAALEDTQNALVREIIEWLQTLKTTKGKIDNVPENVKRALSARRQIRKWLRQNGYYEAITAFGKQYDALLASARDYYKAIDQNPVFTRLDLESLASVKAADLNFMINNDQRVINIIYNEIRTGVFRNKSWRELATTIENIGTGNAATKGLLQSFNRTYAQTYIAAFDRKIQQVKSAELDAEKFIYAGGILKDSRDFCKERFGGTYRKSEVESWNNLQWNGKITGCDIFTCLGGYNCTHSLQPTWFTDEELGEFESIYDAALMGE